MFEVTDTVHGFGKRPHFTPEEIDMQCQNIIFDFLREKYSKINFPISTDDLTILIERYVEDLDMYYEFDDLGQEKIEGVTLFSKNTKPSVCICGELANKDNYENRLRTTLTHELGHVVLHNFIIQIRGKFDQKCKRSNIENPGPKDWMEWQASYASGAFLMPIADLRRFVLSIGDKNRNEIIAKVSERYHVSLDAARVRLEQKKLL